MDHRTEKLMAFLDASVSVYHAAAYLSGMLEDAGYTRLSEGESWNLTAGGAGISRAGDHAQGFFDVCQPL